MSENINESIKEIVKHMKNQCYDETKYWKSFSRQNKNMKCHKNVIST